MKTLLADLSVFYENVGLMMRKSLLASIFPSGMVWSYPGLPKQEIRPLYQAIRTTDSLGVAMGDPSSPCFESSLAWLDHLRLVYEESDQE